MTSVAVAPGSLGAPPSMLTPKMYHLQQGLNSTSPSATSGKVVSRNIITDRKRRKIIACFTTFILIGKVKIKILSIKRFFFLLKDSEVNNFFFFLTFFFFVWNNLKRKMIHV